LKVFRLEERLLHLEECPLRLFLNVKLDTLPAINRETMVMVIEEGVLGETIGTLMQGTLAPMI
jgi:hypothetical protein